MFVGVQRLELHVPASGSLKSKRHVVKSLIGGAQARFHVAVAEVDHQDTWQRAALGVACVSESAAHARRILDEVHRWMLSEARVEILSVTSDVICPEDE